MARVNFSLGCLLFLCGSASAQSPDTVTWLQKFLTDWQVICQKELRISSDPLPWIIVYDATHAWHINPDRKLLPKPHRATRNTVRFSARRYKIYEATHANKLWLPGRAPVDIAPMAVAMPFADGKKAYFVLGTPEFMVARKFPVESEASREFRSLLEGLAMHELAHTRQLPQLMPLLDELQKRYKFPESIDDNLVENTFAQNADFKAVYDRAAGYLQAAVMAADDATAKEQTRQALQAIRAWQSRFFTGDRDGWAEMENVFLTLEGAGQWVLYRHALRKAPPDEAWQQTLIRLASATDSWSQSLGLGLFLLIDRFVPDWSAKYFSKSPPPSPVAVLEAATGSAQSR